jgi:hypothetical protein
MFLLVIEVSSAAANVPESLAKWSAGKRIEVKLNSGGKLVGHLGSVESDGFVLAPDKLGGPQRVLRFDEVRSIKAKMTVTRKCVIAGLVFVAVDVGMALMVGD